MELLNNLYHKIDDMTDHKLEKLLSKTHLVTESSVINRDQYTDSDCNAIDMLEAMHPSPDLH